jgi:hypothetical protein
MTMSLMVIAMLMMMVMIDIIHVIVIYDDYGVKYDTW